MEKLLGLLFIALILSTPAAFASAKAKLDVGQEQQEVLRDDKDKSLTDGNDDEQEIERGDTDLPGPTLIPTTALSPTPTPSLTPAPLKIENNFQDDSSLRQFFNLLKRLLFTLRSPTSSPQA